VEINFYGDYYCNRLSVFLSRFEFPAFKRMHSVGVKASSQRAKDVNARGRSFGTDGESENRSALKL
jgi:hypothetical protein